MRIYFKIEDGDPEIQHILIEKGSATWNTVADQLGRDWLNDVYEDFRILIVIEAFNSWLLLSIFAGKDLRI